MQGPYLAVGASYGIIGVPCIIKLDEAKPSGATCLHIEYDLYEHHGQLVSRAVTDKRPRTML